MATPRANEQPVVHPMEIDPRSPTAGQERHRRAMLSTLTASGFGYLMTALSFVAVPLYLNWLGVGAYGRFLTLLAFMGYLNFADAGLNWGALVLIGQAHGRRDHPAVALYFHQATALAVLSAGLALAAAMAVYALGWAGHRLPMFAEGPAPGTSLLLIGFKSAFMLSTSGVMAMAYGLQEGYWFSRVQGCFQVLGVGLMLAAAWWWHDVDAVVAASTLASGLAAACTLLLAGKRYGNYVRMKVPLSLESFREQFRTGAKSFLLQGSRLVRTTLPLFIVASYGGSGEVPNLTLPLTLLGVVGGFLFNWSASLQTAYGEAWAKGDKDWIAATVRQVVERGLGWLALASGLVLAIGRPFVDLWTHHRVNVPWPMLASAVALTASSWLADAGIFALVGINRQRRIALVELLNTALAAVAAAAVCRAGHVEYIGFAILGAAVATTWLASRRELARWLETTGFIPAWPVITRLIIAGIGTAAVLALLQAWWTPAASPLLAWFRIVVLGATGTGIFPVASAALGLTSAQWPGIDWIGLVRKKFPTGLRRRRPKVDPFRPARALATMNSRQVLLPVYRSLRPVVDAFHLNALARPIWAALWRGPKRELIRARQNDRQWWLDPIVALGGEYYEAETVAWLRQVIKPGMTVVDIGANVGQLTLEMAVLVGSAGRVVSVEPSPGNLRFLRAHLKANGFEDRVTVVEAACCAADGGELMLEVGGSDPHSIENGPQLAGLGLNPNPIDRERPRTRFTVRTRSVDALCAEMNLAVDVMKIDVEGAELEVFRGAEATLAGHRPRIIFGFHPFAFADAERARREIEGILGRAGLEVEDAPPAAAWAMREYRVGLR